MQFYRARRLVALGALAPPRAGECRLPPGEEVLLLLFSDPSQAGVGVILPPVWPQTLRHKTSTLPLA